MPLSELTTESYFKTTTLVRDWWYYHFCGHMFHPPLLASNWFLFFLCLNRDIFSTCCYCDILLHYAKHLCFKSVLCSSTWMSHRRLCLILVELHKRRFDFHICVGICVQSSSRAVSNLGQERSVPTSIHMMWSVLWDVVLLVLVLFEINVELKLLYCCLFPLSSEHKWDQPRHDACCFVTTNSASPPL